MKLHLWAKQYAKKHNLEYRELTIDHYRISDGKRYVDFWTTGSIRHVNGKYFRVGSTKRGFNARWTDHQYGGNFDYIKNEIKKLRIKTQTKK